MATSSIVSKTALVLDIVCARSEPLSFTQIARATGLQKSATHRILSILREERLVEQAARLRQSKPLVEISRGSGNLQDLMSAADSACYVAKQRGVSQSRTSATGYPFPAAKS